MNRAVLPLSVAPQRDLIGRVLRGCAMLVAALLLAGCDGFHGGSVAAAPLGASAAPSTIAAVPLGDVAGEDASHLSASVPNPYQGSAEAVQQGHHLYVRMNCAGCHGYAGQGGIGPPLADRYWRYGGAPVSIFKSIYEGRPQGMPAWNPGLPPSEIWKIVAWIQSLGGSYDADGYQASLQGDLPGDKVSPHAERTLPAPATADRSDGTNRAQMQRSAAPSPSRPDPGGNQ